MGDASAAPPATQEVPWKGVFGKAPGATLLATGLGAGFLPKAPGTWGSLLAVAAAEGLLSRFPLAGVVVLAGVSTAAGFLVTGRVASLRGRKDPPEIVIDEVAGQSVSLALLHLVLPAAAPPPLRWGLVALSFGLFRVLDIAKPGPVDRVQALPGARGVMADDLLAGLVSGIAAAAAAFLLR